MYSLLLDSSNILLAVGIAKDDKLIDSISYECWQRQSEYMIKEIDNILKKNDINPKNIDEVIVTLGPGSFTGLRIALTIAKIFGVALNINIYAISSLEILKDDDKPSICLMNARSNRSYIGVYKNKDVILKDTIFTNEEVLKYIDDHKDYSICGDVEYLGLTKKYGNIFDNMLKIKNENNLVKDVLKLKAIYLKD